MRPNIRSSHTDIESYQATQIVRYIHALIIVHALNSLLAYALVGLLFNLEAGSVLDYK